MIEGDLLSQAVFIVEIEDNVVVLDRSNVRKVNAGKGIVAFGAFLLAAGTGNDFTVKDNVDTVCFIAAGKEKTVA